VSSSSESVHVWHVSPIQLIVPFLSLLVFSVAQKASLPWLLLIRQSSHCSFHSSHQHHTIASYLAALAVLEDRWETSLPSLEIFTSTISASSSYMWSSTNRMPPVIQIRNSRQLVYSCKPFSESRLCPAPFLSTHAVTAAWNFHSFNVSWYSDTRMICPKSRWNRWFTIVSSGGRLMHETASKCSFPKIFRTISVYQYILVIKYQKFAHSSMHLMACSCSLSVEARNLV